jgi:Anti-sigma-K factor rskA
MSHPDLFALLRGELPNVEATSAGAHLDDCADCRRELAELAVGNALLSRAARTLEGAGPAAAPTSSLPPLRQPAAHRTRRRVPDLAVAAAAVVVGAALGVAGATALDEPSAEDAPTQAAYASVSLSPVEGSAAGEARMVEESGQQTRMVIEVSGLHRAGNGRFYYAWLLDPETDKMLPLGQLDPNGTASFSLDDALVESYSAIDVSLEDDDGDPGHSVTSVLRGSYDVDERSSSS